MAGRVEIGRDGLPTAASWRILDHEANVFAVHLLMPTDLFRTAVGRGFDISDDESLARIARRFRVPLGAVMFRLMLDMKLRGF